MSRPPIRLVEYTDSKEIRAPYRLTETAAHPGNFSRASEFFAGTGHVLTFQFLMLTYISTINIC
jgi:hypothetical protein